MITADQFRKALEPQLLDDAALDAMLDAAAQVALRARCQEFTLTIPRHSIERAAELARSAGFRTHIRPVRSPLPDAPDTLDCSLDQLQHPRR